MVGKVKMMKTKWYPNPHSMEHSWFHGLESTAAHTTIYPLLHYDEGRGNPAALETHPENAAFVVDSSTSCFPESRIDSIFCEIVFDMTKASLVTDLLPAIKVGFMPIFTSFDDALVVDELSSIEIQDVLEITRETTDNQTFPLYNDTKMAEKFSNSALLHATMPGLTTTQVLEGITFDLDQYYDSLQFLTISEKMKKVSGGMKWLTLTKAHPFAKVKIRIRPKNKRMNKFNFLGVLITTPLSGTHRQYAVATDTTNLTHLGVSVRTRYNEWNQNFEFSKISA